MPEYPKYADPNKNPFDLLAYLGWRAEKYPRAARPTKEKPARVHNLKFHPFAAIRELVRS